MMAKSEDGQEDRPLSLTLAALSVLLAFAALIGFCAAVCMVFLMFATHTLWGPWGWPTPAILAAGVLISGGAIWGTLRLQPLLRAAVLPFSPATRRTMQLYKLMQLVGAMAALALIYGTQSDVGKNFPEDLPFGVFSNGTDDPLGIFSNRPVSLGFAVFAITSWLLAMAIGLRRYLSADEHERQANDFGKLVAFRLFFTVTPAWWVATRAGLLPQPNAMVLWLLTLLVAATTSFWRRWR
jgi:MFS family permease